MDYGVKTHWQKQSMIWQFNKPNNWRLIDHACAIHSSRAIEEIVKR